MPASYVHQCIAERTAKALDLFHSPEEHFALLAGSEGPDPLFFSLIGWPGANYAPHFGNLLHTKKTDEFLAALCENSKHDALTRAYCCGFFAHYAADTTCHPYVYAHSLNEQGAYSGTLHCTLEHQLETLRFRLDGHAESVPVQMAGFARLTSAQKDCIARAFHAAFAQVFLKSHPSISIIRRSFDDAVSVCRLLRSEDGKRYARLGALLSPVKLDAALHAHMMPLHPPEKDIANTAHQSWTSIWAPEIIRSESFWDLFEQSVLRAQALMTGALGYMDGSVSRSSLLALHGALSYDSGLHWQKTCPANEAPGACISR